MADFGLSRDTHLSDYYRLKTQRQKLPVKWMAPESLFQKLYSVKTDVVSIDIIIAWIWIEFFFFPLMSVVIWNCVLGDIQIWEEALCWHR